MANDRVGLTGSREAKEHIQRLTRVIGKDDDGTAAALELAARDRNRSRR